MDLLSKNEEQHFSRARSNERKERVNARPPTRLYETQAA